MSHLAVNPKTSAKQKPRGKPFSGKNDPRNNTAGAPKRGESWAEIIKRIGDMTPKEAAEHARSIAGKLASMGDGLTLKEAVVVRVYASLLFEPQPGLLNSFMERAEGKVSTPIDVTTDGEKITKVDFDYGKLLGSVASRPSEDHIAPGEDEGLVHGEAVRKDDTGGTAGAGSV
jgi:hypothetical protein